jgi:hypothetical protein
MKERTRQYIETTVWQTCLIEIGRHEPEFWRRVEARIWKALAKRLIRNYRFGDSLNDDQYCQCGSLAREFVDNKRYRSRM